METCKQPTCEQRIDASLASTLETLRELYAVYCGEAEPTDEITRESFLEHGLSFDYVPSNMFEDQAEAYWRYQLSWGGPSDEFRFYASWDGHHGATVYRIEYWFLDWFDGAGREVRGKDRRFLIDAVWDLFNECGTVEQTMLDTME